VVAVAAGPGLGEIFRSLGAAAIVNGGQTNNPSTQEIFEALEGVPTDKIIILPNNKNIILAAEAACDLSDKQVVVVPTRTFPQGVGAILSYDPDGDLEDVKAAMSAAFHHVTSGEITIATRSVTLDGVKVKKGETIGLVDGRLCTSGKEIDKVLLETLRAMAIEHRELLSVYYGQDVSRLEATRVLAHIEEHFPSVEVELLSGGQPHYMFILGAE
jgi:dihydroxyacetone kinase-like predicted kinase